MNELDEALKVSFGYKVEALYQLILLRFQSLINISAIAFAVDGVILSTHTDLGNAKLTEILPIIIFGAVAMVSLGRYLYLVRHDIDQLTRKIDEQARSGKFSTSTKPFSADYWPEILFVFLVVGVILFSISLFNC